MKCIDKVLSWDRSGSLAYHAVFKADNGYVKEEAYQEVGAYYELTIGAYYVFPDYDFYWK